MTEIRFGYLNLVNWNLFGIWLLGFNLECFVRQ
jgi:hypothetical protein